MNSELLAIGKGGRLKNTVSVEKAQVHMIVSLKPGTSAILASIEGETQIVERLGELGFVPGEAIVFQRRIPFQGPLIIEVRGVPVALREEEARCLKVRP